MILLICNCRACWIWFKKIEIVCMCRLAVDENLSVFRNWDILVKEAIYSWYAIASNRNTELSHNSQKLITIIFLQTLRFCMQGLRNCPKCQAGIYTVLLYYLSMIVHLHKYGYLNIIMYKLRIQYTLITLKYH